MLPLPIALVLATGLALLASPVAGAAPGHHRTKASSGSKITACFMVSSVGIHDHGFNQEGWDALVEAQKSFGVKIRYLEKSGSTTFTTIGSEFISQGCNLIVGEGFTTADTIQRLAEANPTVKFALIDDTLTKPLHNVSELFYHTDQGAFLAGYIAAATTKKKVIGMMGNEPIPPVLTYLNGFYAGVQYYNKINKAHVKTIGYTPIKHTGEFMGSFTNTAVGTQIANTELSQGADIIYAVAVPQTVAVAVLKYGHGTGQIGVDSDGCVAYPSQCGAFVTSVLKNITPSLYDVISSLVKGHFDSGIYNGTLQNDGVGIAPYHDWTKRVPSAAKAKVKTLLTEIVEGKINFDPYKA